MAAIYESWGRLVTATLRREEFRESALRTPSDLSSLSASSSQSFHLSSNYTQVSSFLVGESLSYLQILKATNLFDDSNLIKRGHSGDLYFGVLQNGTEVVVKKVDVSSMEKELCFISEIEIYGTIQHSRLIPLLGHCLGNANEKFLVYKYRSNMDLSRFLNGNVEGYRRAGSTLDWTTRLKIATGVLEGLCYLHHECVPSLVHRDVQASSILLDDKFEVQLGSLTGVCVEEKDSDNYKIPRFLWLSKGLEQSSHGTSNATCAFDVYHFGKVLLELITGKLSTPIIDSSRKEWLASTLRYIVPDNKKLIINIVDPSLIINDDLLMEVWAISFIAKMCLSRNPRKRPQVEEIRAVLYSLASLIGGRHPRDHPSPVALIPGIKLAPGRFKRIGRLALTIKQDDISGGSTTSRMKFDHLRIRRILEGYSAMKPQRYSYADIKKITNCFGCRLGGEGGYGSVFKGKLRNEVDVAVKLLKSSVTNREVLINEMASVGMIHHENVVRLLGFCVDEFQIALVYEYLHRGSLDYFIHRDSQDNQALGVETLHLIAVGIARGIEYLHQGCQQTILHFDIQPKNILLDGNWNPKISDFGLAKLCGKEISFVSLTAARGTNGYIAPEIFSSQVGDASCKSDVYSYGMLLLEMVVGRMNFHSQFDFSKWVYRHFIKVAKEINQVEEDSEGKIIKKLAIVGLWCIQWKPENRPSMTCVLQMLEESVENLSLPKYPIYLTQFYTKNFSLSEYDSE